MMVSNQFNTQIWHVICRFWFVKMECLLTLNKMFKSCNSVKLFIVRVNYLNENKENKVSHTPWKTWKRRSITNTILRKRCQRTSVTNKTRGEKCQRSLITNKALWENFKQRQPHNRHHGKSVNPQSQNKVPYGKVEEHQSQIKHYRKTVKAPQL